MTDTLLIGRGDLGTLEPLGKGGTALIYGLPDVPAESLGVVGAEGLVYKEYKPAIRQRAGPGLLPGLRALVAFRQTHLADQQRIRWDQRIIWPVRLVVDTEGAATGIVMPLIPYRFFQRVTKRAGPPQLEPREVEKLFGDVGTMRRIGMAPVPERLRVQLVAQIATTYAMMHRGGIVIGDISQRNLVYDPGGGRPPVLALDTDSARVEGTRSAFSSQPHTPHWQPPEALANPSTAQSKRTDVYKFGLLVVRILDYGRGCSVNRDPATAVAILHRTLGRDVAKLLTASLADDPAGRPTLRDWYDAIYAGSRTRSESDSGSRTGRVVVEPSLPSGSGGLLDGMVVGDWVFVRDSGWHRRGSHP